MAKHRIINEHTAVQQEKYPAQGCYPLILQKKGNGKIDADGI